MRMKARDKDVASSLFFHIYLGPGGRVALIKFVLQRLFYPLSLLTDPHDTLKEKIYVDLHVCICVCVSGCHSCMGAQGGTGGTG